MQWRPCIHSRASPATVKSSTAAKNNYTMTFPGPAARQPVNRVSESLTMYDGKTQLLIEKSDQPHLVTSPMCLNEEDCGRSLTLYIQNKFSRRGQGSELAPAPEGDH